MVDRRAHPNVELAYVFEVGDCSRGMKWVYCRSVSYRSSSLPAKSLAWRHLFRKQMFDGLMVDKPYGSPTHQTLRIWLANCRARLCCAISL